VTKPYPCLERRHGETCYSLFMESVPDGMPTPHRRLTIRDVAREAGVGVGTASRALSGSPHVSASARQRVLDAVEFLGFFPSLMAQGLVKGKTQTLGVLVPFFTKHYFLEILRGVEQAAASQEYSLVIYNVERREQALAHLNFLARTRRVDGLVVIALSGKLISAAYSNGPPFPIVCIDTRMPGAISLSIDHKQGMYLAVQHLIEMGHKRIALIDRPQDPVSGTRSRARQNGYLKAHREAALPISNSLMVVADYSQEEGYEAASKMLGLRQRPTAFACASDLQAIGALQAIRGQGLRVPVDIAVTGYHDVELAQWVSLTTVRIPAFEMGRAAVGILLARLAGRPVEGPASFRPELVVRETTMIPARKK
jgi:DNA-binding LacI/PurR family transcriptional regulator